jgi:hypothetical protein
MAPKSAHDAAKAKAAKEKKILIVLALPLLLALFFAYHTVTKLHQSSAPVAVAPAATPSTATTSSSGASATPVATGTPISATLPTAPSPPPDAGKLSRMTLFAAKDPFFDGGPKVATSSGQSKQPQQKQAKQAKQKAVPPAAAVIAVNGRLSVVSAGQAFPVTKDPATNGVFRLVSLTAKSAKVAVVGGSYTTGAHALTLTVDSVVTLVNTADGKRYTLVLYPQGTPAPGATPTTTTTGP